MTYAFFLPAFMSNHNCSNGTFKILAQAQTFTRRLFKSVPVASGYCVALQMHLNILTPRLLLFWMISGAICLCFDWGWAHVSQQNTGQKKGKGKSQRLNLLPASVKTLLVSVLWRRGRDESKMNSSVIKFFRESLPKSLLNAALKAFLQW